MTILNTNQKKTENKAVTIEGIKHHMTVEIRYDDQCKNGHNTFSITADIRSFRGLNACGCLHDEIAEHFPHLKKYIKWHLTSSDEPLYYIENTTHHARNGNLEYARSSAVWNNATLEQLKDENKLKRRLPNLMKNFEKAMNELGFVY